MRINNIDELKEMAHDFKAEIGNESAFEKLLKVLTDFGMDEDKAAQMIADCIDEQYELDKVAETLHEIYQDAKEVVINNGEKFEA